jgi:hypothetical protein
MSRLLKTLEAARFLSLSPRTLERFRLEGSGPRYCKLRRSGVEPSNGSFVRRI